MSTFYECVGEVGDNCLDAAIRGRWDPVIRRYNECDAKRRMIDLHTEEHTDESHGQRLFFFL